MRDAGESPLAAVHPATVHPDEVDTGEIEAALGSADPLVRQRACKVCETLVEEDVESVRPLGSEIGGLLHDRSAAVVQTALSVLTTLAATEPVVLESCLDDLVSVTETELNGVKLESARCLAALTLEKPGACVPHVPALVQTVVDAEGVEAIDDCAETVTDPSTRQTIREHNLREYQDGENARELLANVVAAAVESAPSELHDETPSFTKLLSDENPVVVDAGLTALSMVAQDDPTAVAVDDALVDCLGHDARSVRARAIETFGYLGSDTVVPTLRRVADDDPDEDVAALAAVTADFLDS
ncbi:MULTISPECIES: HEAT repeat domain-containing protein [Haloferax]|uniref:HEAT repeat domain-containing protein n=1 Tax=Haloferax marinum TaxID=2666143 RepID=A0A6A8G783_9EURY|nr:MULTISPECIES: HEAT repeat domain-containing protein [Haloferax]KAB1197839.1 HEAT repeat domain-containing protein [Haloferax sp. CBA1150]MRW96901.1 HEAT repeat domain-containing protein [Haloferax marinum]